MCSIKNPNTSLKVSLLELLVHNHSKCLGFSDCPDEMLMCSFSSFAERTQMQPLASASALLAKVDYLNVAFNHVQHSV